MLNGRRRFGWCHRQWMALLSMLSPVTALSARHPAQRAIAVAISSFGTSRRGALAASPQLLLKLNFLRYGRSLSINPQFLG
jgi:hypothetical protein